MYIKKSLRSITNLDKEMLNMSSNFCGSTIKTIITFEKMYRNGVRKIILGSAASASLGTYVNSTNRKQKVLTTSPGNLYIFIHFLTADEPF